MQALTSQRQRAKTRLRAPAQRPNQDLVDMVILDFPVDLKRALVKASNGSNMTNVAVSVLAEEFNIKFHPTDRVSTIQPGDSGRVSLAMPRKLRRRIGVYAKNNDTTSRALVIEKLSERFM